MRSGGGGSEFGRFRGEKRQGGQSPWRERSSIDLSRKRKEQKKLKPQKPLPPPTAKKNTTISWLAITKFDASPTLFYAWASKAGLKGIAAAWPTPFNKEAWTYLAAFGGLQAVLQLCLPGKKVTGPVTPRGNVPVYYANGVLSYFVTLALLGGSAVLGFWRPERVYDVFGEMLSSLNAFSLLLCLALWAKVRLFFWFSFRLHSRNKRREEEGEKARRKRRRKPEKRKKLNLSRPRPLNKKKLSSPPPPPPTTHHHNQGHLAPSSTDSGSTGSLLYDYYWGMELYPRLLKGKFDIKTWTNCRAGMCGWAVLCLCFAWKQFSVLGRVSNSMAITAGLINIYLLKFFVWEPGYWASMDIAHDRAGYYICWGCLVWVQSIYASPALFLAGHPRDLNPLSAASIFAAGLLAIWINYDADRQRQVFRATSGKALVWGKKPASIVASYSAGDGKTQKKSLLLASGWWGLARHFHYLPEIAAAALWTAPCGFTAILAWFYVFFLILLLVDRAFRDDARCAAKYGKDWDRYRALVPAKIIPGVF